MKTTSKSLRLQNVNPGNFCRIRPLFGLLLTISLFTGACAVTRSKDSGYSAKDDSTKDISEVPEELSLKEDRSQLEQLRKEVPDDIKKDNDELAFIMKMMGEVKERPDRIRDRFNSEVRKRRDKFSKINQKEREQFNLKSKKERDDFLKKMDKERTEFSKGKPSSDERKEFFNEQETKRREFFSKQSDERREFDAKMRERQSDFDAYLRDQTGEFNQEHRAYGERFRQWEKDKKQFEEEKRKYEKEQRAKGVIPGMSTSSGATRTDQSNIPEVQKYQYDKDLAEFEKIPPGGDRLKSGDGK